MVTGKRMKCKCDLRTKLVGDGCEFCNPELAAEMRERKTMMHDIKKLPVWAQQVISNLEHNIKALNGLKEAHALLMDHDREWFTVTNNEENPFRLWRFHHDMPTAVCSLSDKDVLLVGRATKDKIHS